MNTTTSAAQDVAEMMRAWNTITGAARAQFPHASEEEIYQMSKQAMERTLRLGVNCVCGEPHRSEFVHTSGSCYRRPSAPSTAPRCPDSGLTTEEETWGPEGDADEEAS